MATWYDIKLATLQKMFAADSTIITDESTLGYIAAMPYAANEALQMLSTAGKFLIKSVTITHNLVPNLVPDTISKHIQSFNGVDKEYVTSKAKSYYFEVTGIGMYKIFVGDDEVATEIVDSMNKFQEFRGLLDNPDGLDVRITFSSLYPMAVRNMAMYDATYPDVSYVPAFREKIPYYMPDIVEDFFELDVQGIYYTGTYSQYLQTTEYYQEGDKTLLIPYDMVGSYTIYYRAYPQPITVETEDEEELALAPEVIALLPLYMASQLYKDDDNGIATSYRNEFEVAFERLKNNANRSNNKEFVGVSGWI